MKPYYELDKSTQHIIRELHKKCIELDLGNVNFHYFATGANSDEVEFYLTEYKDFWELTVRQRRAKTADIYRLTGDAIEYKYSEKD